MRAWTSWLVAVGCAVLPSAPVLAQPDPGPALTPDVRAAVVDSVRAALLRTYVFPDAARTMASRLAERRQAGLYDTLSDRRALAYQITRDLREAHDDAHLRVVYDPEEAARAADTTRQEARDRTESDRRQNFFFRRLDILPGNVGYLEFTRFADTSAVARRTVRAAMAYLAHTDALVLDLRDNRGGSAAMGDEILSYFVDGRAHWSSSYNRLTDAWTQRWVENRPEVTGGLVINMPVTVLTSSWTFSAAEGLAYVLKHNRGARVVGERTGGGAHVLRRVGLGNGFVAFVPYVRSENVATGTDWEGTGVTPDVEAAAPDALVRALETVLGERLAAAEDSSARRAIEWAINDARAEAHRVTVPAGLLEEYAGRYEEYTFSVRDGRLFSENAMRSGKTDVLVPVTEALFKLDAESQVEFIRDESGRVTGLRLLWNDGWVDILPRSG